jgi:hypothetical protein
VKDCTTGGDQSVGQVSLLHSPGGNMVWVGLESDPGAAITSGISGAAGAHIVFISAFHDVDIRTASADTILIRNASTGTRAGNVTLIW